MTQLKQEKSCYVGGKRIKRLDVGPKDQSMYRQKASGCGFGHWAKKSRYCTKDIGVEESTGRLDNRPQERTMHRRIRRSVDGPMTCRTIWLLLSINYLDRSVFYMFMINNDSKAWSKMKSSSQGRDYVGSSRVRRKSRRSSEVLSELAEKSRSLPEKLVGTRQEDRHEVQELAGSLPEHCQEIVGSLPKE